jgi:indolepyruvate ferredoxin oxidoreductase
MNAPLDRAFRDALDRAIAEVTLDDKYTLEHGRAFMSGTQALVRLPMLQRQRDVRAGLNTAGFISGYRGSPLGAVDQSLWKAKKHLAANHIVFQPGLNEDLAATSIWGSQQVNLFPGARYDGVFGMWYGKGPGVDRCGDVFKHANAAGSSKHGGVLVLAGDDHGAKSSTLPHQSDHIFKACGLPVFYPSSVQEYLDHGLHAWAMSRYSGLWSAMKTVTEVVESSASVEIDPERVKIILPEDFSLPAGGLNIRWPDPPLEQEARLLDYKFYAGLAYIRANRLNHIVIDSPRAWFGIMTAGKAYLDTRQALDDLGLDEPTCVQLGIRLFKVGVVWPLEAQTVREFATGLEEILVVEEKRQLMEYALKEELYNWRDDVRPKIYGKFDEKDGHGGEWAVPMGNWLLPAHNELSPSIIAKAIAARLLNPGKYESKFALDPQLRSRIEARLHIIEGKERSLAHVTGDMGHRTPTFCSGCPHNTSTKVPEGSRAVAGIGCHYMAVWKPERHTSTFTQMGGEGTPWIGQAPFTDTTHIFANLGDGTYFHSGLLAIRASIAAGVNITYKVLYNDAVAMTGGQPIDGTLTVPQIVAQLKAEGAKRVVVVTDEPEKYDSIKAKEPFVGVAIQHRDYLDMVQRQLREETGCTVMVYDQTCASEKRRRRKKIVDGVPGFPDPAKRVVINEAVCEGCGDCSVASSCVSVEPLETEFGRKRKINQSTCNKDYSCVNGFCPSFVTVEGGKLKSGKKMVSAAGETPWPPLPEPQRVALAEPGVVTNEKAYGILVTGVGGTGVVTIGQLLGMAAHLEGKGVSVLDMAGLAQKGGAVFSHVQIAESRDAIYSTRIAMGDADLLIGCDLVVSSGPEALSKIRRGVTRAVVNSDLTPTADFLSNPDWKVQGDVLRDTICEAAGQRDMDFFEANVISVALMGDSLYTNPMMLGYAWQRGWIPLTQDSLLRAMELNAIQVEKNKAAFEWGRRAAHDLAAVLKVARPAQVVEFKRQASLSEAIQLRVRELTEYQNADYAKRYSDLVAKVSEVEAQRVGASLQGKAATRLSHAVAKYYFKLLAYKDEYEVARLHSNGALKAKVDGLFEGDFKLRYHLAPPLLSQINRKTGQPRKIQFGAWMGGVFSVLAKFKFLRGTAFDLFGRTEERVHERQLIVEYEQTVSEVLAKLTPQNYDLGVSLLSVPEHIRGYGHVKATHLAKAKLQRDALKAQFDGAQSGTEKIVQVIDLKRA